MEVDSKLASSSGISGVKELLNGCICCNLVGQLGDALQTLRRDVSPARVIIETSGSAFPATLAMEVNRLARETGDFVLDGVVVVIDVENWKGYNDTSYTAKMQARFTDLIVFNKWELVDERRYEDCLDRVGDLEVQVANVKSDQGRVEANLLLGLDSTFARDGESWLSSARQEKDHQHATSHHDEVEIISIELSCPQSGQTVNGEELHNFLSTASVEDMYRIKGVVSLNKSPESSDQALSPPALAPGARAAYILNWAFGRWTFFPGGPIVGDTDGADLVIARITIVLARNEADKWATRIRENSFITPNDPRVAAELNVKRVL